MLLYAFINILLFFGVFSASWEEYMRQPPPSFAEYLSAFMLPGGGIALLLAPLAYGLLQWRHRASDQPTWRQQLLPLWLGLVTYSGLCLPLGITAAWMWVRAQQLVGWTDWHVPLLVGGEMLLLIILGWFVMKWRWFTTGLVIGYILCAGGVVGWGRLFLGDIAWGYPLLVGYGGSVSLLGGGIVVRAIGEAWQESARARHAEGPPGPPGQDRADRRR